MGCTKAGHRFGASLFCVHSETILSCTVHTSLVSAPVISLRCAQDEINEEMASV